MLAVVTAVLSGCSDATLAAGTNSAGSKLAAAPLGASETKLHGAAISISRACSSSIGSENVTGAATCGLCTTHSVSRVGGNGLDSASGIATKNTNTPHSSPANTIA